MFLSLSWVLIFRVHKWTQTASRGLKKGHIDEGRSGESSCREKDRKRASPGTALIWPAGPAFSSYVAPLPSKAAGKKSPAGIEHSGHIASRHQPTFPLSLELAGLARPVSSRAHLVSENSKKPGEGPTQRKLTVRDRQPRVQARLTGDRRFPSEGTTRGTQSSAVQRLVNTISRRKSSAARYRKFESADSR